MRSFAIHSIELTRDYNEAFDYIANPANLPEWTNAFASISEGGAVLQTPSGTQTIELTVTASRERGTIDWVLRFGDGSQATAYSRLVRLGPGRCAYAFLLTPPPAPLDQLEGTLDQQSEILKEELARLKHILHKDV